MTKLRVEGEIELPSELGFAELAALPDQIEDVGTLVPGRSGRAVHLRTVFEAVRVRSSAQWATLGAADGSFEICVPREAIGERGLVVYGLNDGPLPRSSGGPVRVLIAGAPACGGAELDACASVKDLGLIRLTSTREPDVGHVHT